MSLTKPIMVVATALSALGLVTACGQGTAAEPDEGQDAVGVSEQSDSSEQASTPSDVLASTAWETTGATDASGEEVPLTDENVSDFVGWAYFIDDGTFTMYTLDDEPKMQGDWTVSADGSTRHIVAKDDAGEVLFERDSEIVTLTEDEFTYRVFPDGADQDVYYDIVHTPTDHEEPAA